jgi:hypothetical protein
MVSKPKHTEAAVSQPKLEKEARIAESNALLEAVTKVLKEASGKVSLERHVLLRI